MTQKEATKAAEGRTKRIPLRGKQPLAVRGKESGFHYRIVNDRDDRIADFLDAGYEVVRDTNVSVGDKSVDRASTEGTVKRISVGAGDKAVLMRIPDEYYNEDQNAKLKHLQDLEDATKKDALSGRYGSLDLTRD